MIKLTGLYFRATQSLLLGGALFASSAVFANIDVDALNGTSLKIDNFATNAPTLNVGINFKGNSLTITNTGSVLVDDAFIGSKDIGDNTLLVTGSGSHLQAKNSMTVGTDNSIGNILEVTDGASIHVGDVNTDVMASGGIAVGSTNGTASLTIGSGTTATAETLLIGAQPNETGSVVLSGTDTTLDLADNLLLGPVGNDNTLTVDSGATLTIGNELQIGSTNSANNQLTIDNGGSVTVLGATTISDTSINSITVNSGGHLGITEGINLDSTTNGFNISNGASLQLGGTLETVSLDKNIDITLDGPGASWTTVGDMYVGDEINGNKLIVQNGAAITNAENKILYVGFESNNNEVHINGTNSHLEAQGSAFVGNKGDNNSLTIENSGTADIDGFLFVGNTSGASDNNVYIRSEGQLTVQTNIFIGFSGTGNQLHIEEGGMLDAQGDIVLGVNSAKNRYFLTGGTNTVAGEFIIGKTEAATGVTYNNNSGNVATVGEDALLDIQHNLTVGQEGGGSILLINDGGTVNVDGNVVIGEVVGDNYIFLEPDDPDSRFIVTGDLVVGKGGEDNRFAVYGGTARIDGDVYVGTSTNQHVKKNYIHLETTNAVLNVANAIYIGASNSVNTLDLAKGAQASAKDLYVGTYEGVSNNVVTIAGDESLLTVSNTLAIGSNTGSNNTVNIDDGGILFVGGDINIGAATNDLNNRLNINSGGTLQTIDWDYATVSTNILLNSGSTLHLLGSLEGTNMVEGGLNFVLDGAGSSWNTGTNNLFVGYETDNNSLTITNGALATTATNLHIGFASARNTIMVGGAGSLLAVTNDLFIGMETNTSAYQNELFVLDGGSVDVGNDLINAQEGTLKIGAGSQVRVAGNYEQKYNEEYQAGARLEVGVSSNATAPNLKVGGTANFEEDTTIAVYDDGVHGNTNVVQTIVLANELTFEGQAATTGLLGDLLNIETNSLLDFDITVSNNMIIVDNFIVLDIGDEFGLEGQLLDIANELIGMATNGNELAEEWKRTIGSLTPEEGKQAINNYYGEKASSAPMHNVINQGIGSIASELTSRGDTTRERAMASVPFGTPGPHTWDQELQGWIGGYGSWGTMNADGGFHGYDASMGGFVVGVDLAIFKSVLLGLAGGSNSGSVDKENGASGDTKTTYGAVYTSVGTKSWFANASLIYGDSSIDNTLGETFDTTASYDARNIAFHLGGGKEIFGKYLVITPQASLLANYYEQDSYDEKSTSAEPRSMDGFDALYLQSSLGGSLGLYTTMGKVALKPELRAHWLHEFNGDDESLPYHLTNDADETMYNMHLQTPEKDLLKLGAGISAKISEYLELRFDLDTRLGKNYLDGTATGSLRYQF